MLDATDYELNNLSYYDAAVFDRRSLCQIYLSFIRTNQILVFTFKCTNDFNSPIIKILFFFLNVCLLLFVNIAFITENTLHDIYISGGKLDLLYNIYSILYATLIVFITKNILIKYIFTEGDVISIKYTKKEKKKKVIFEVLSFIVLRSGIFVLLSILFLIFEWFYISCFFTVFKNTRFYAIKNTLISFGIFLIAPFFFYIFPASFRRLSLKSGEKHDHFWIYTFSNLLLSLC